MKNNLILIFFMLLTVVAVGQSAVNQEKEYVINGTLKGDYKADYVYLTIVKAGVEVVVDSCKVVDNHYEFKGKVPKYVLMHVIKSGVKNRASSTTELFLESGNISVMADATYFGRSEVRGGVNNMLLSFYRCMFQSVMDSLTYEFRIQKALYGEKDEATELEELEKRSKLTSRRQLQIMLKFATDYPGQPFSAYVLGRWLKNKLPLEQIKELRKKLDPALNSHPYVKELDDFIAMSTFGVGSEIPDVSLPDVNGKRISLKSFRGKYVLIDFWASWCGPCIKEMPNVVKLYKECKGKNFEILGVSLDNKKEAWQAMVKKQGMKWPQVCDFKSWYSPLARSCNIQAVPATILVSPEGKVVAMNLRGEQLIRKVKEVLGKH